VVDRIDAPETADLDPDDNNFDLGSVVFDLGLDIGFGHLFVDRSSVLVDVG